MPIHNDLITLSDTTPTLVVPTDSMPQEVHFHNMTKSSNEYIHLGNADMTLTNSIHIDPGETVTYTIPPGDELFAMSDPDGLELGVLRILQD
jgi:hypothetical protein